MAVKTGRSAIIAYEQTSSTWGTAVAPTALDEILCTSFGPLAEIAEMQVNDEAGYSWPEIIHKAIKTVTPEIVMPLRFSGRLWSFVAQVFGIDSKTGAADPYTHTMTCADSIDGSDKFGTLACEIGGTLMHEWPSVKPIGFTMEGPDSFGYMTLTVRTICDQLLLGSDGLTASGDYDNVTHMTLDSVTPKKVPFSVLRLRVNTDSGALDSNDDIYVSNINFTFDRDFGPELVNRGAVASEFETAEPIEGGIPTVTLGFTLNDYNALTWVEALQDQTTAKAQLYFDYDTTHYLEINFPLLKTMPFEPAIPGPNRIPQPLQFQVMLPGSAVTGMAELLPFLKLLDEQSVAYE